MTEKPIHYDGSMQNNNGVLNDSDPTEPFTISDEMRKNIGGNPFISEK